MIENPKEINLIMTIDRTNMTINQEDTMRI